MKFEDIALHLGNFTAGIAGAGGLGSNCAVAMVRSGIGRLVIADFDTVTLSNLNRQFYFADQAGMKKVDALRENLDRIGTGCTIQVYDTVVSRSNIESIFSNCDIIIEAFDSPEMKEMLAAEVLTRWPGKPLILGSGMAGYGSSNDIRAKDLGENLYICGDERSEVTDDLPAMGPRVGIVANMQANLAIEILMKMEKVS